MLFPAPSFSMNSIFSAIKLFFFSAQQRKNQFIKSSRSLRKEEQEELSSLGCNDSATANLVGIDSIAIDSGSSNKIFAFFFLSIVNFQFLFKEILSSSSLFILSYFILFYFISFFLSTSASHEFLTMTIKKILLDMDKVFFLQ